MVKKNNFRVYNQVKNNLEEAAVSLSKSRDVLMNGKFATRL